ncbi:MAG: 1-acyl-sn-glycerol-3-phosphate acyltransferase [Planctomycetota bacterium]|nr:1-acyl-sn-glycerol-3-phosphate acyltransferase [Planctomycetota bacterium]
MLTIRSLLFTLSLFLSSLIGGALELLIFWAPFRWKWSVARGWANYNLWAGKFFCGMEVVTEGSENLPDEASVALIKHTTAMETYWQIAALPPQVWVLKRELLLIPLFGWGVGLIMKPIAINRKAGAPAVRQVIEQGKDRLSRGLWISMFPEGTRMAPGETRRYGVSGAAVAKEVGCPIVPVAHNAGDLWPRRGLRKHAGTIRFCIGPPIDPTGQSPKETNLIAQDWIENKMREISSVYGNRS